MRKDTFIGEVSGGMAQRGWPCKYVRRLTREISDHWHELEQEGRERGLDESAACDFAGQRLGDPNALIASYQRAMRDASWAGRHPVVSFILLPPLALMLWFLCWIGMAGGASDLYAKLLSLKTPAWGSYLTVLFGVKVIHYTGVFAVPALFWWWARSSFRSFNWGWMACGICALHGLFNHVTVRLHDLRWAYGIASVDWLTVLAPLLVAAVAHAYERPKRVTVLSAFACASMLLMGCASSKIPQQRGWIGGEYKPVRQLKANGSRGLLITALRTNTPAAQSGLHEGDLIIQAAGKPLNDLPAFQQIIDAAQPGSTVPVSVLRDGNVLDLRVRAGRETFTPTRSIVIGLLLSREWDPWPNPDFSLVALGYRRQHKRLDLHSPESRFKLANRDQEQCDDPANLRSSEGWEIWLPIVSFSSRKRILSQSDAESQP
jgi:PDZ domain-containing protein